jgi:hypothetical protein
MKTTSTSMHKQLIKSPKHLTYQELLRAQQANALHHINHASDDVLRAALDNGIYAETNLTGQDVTNMRFVYGPCPACYEGKATVPAAASESLNNKSYKNGELLHMDIQRYDGKTIGGNTTVLMSTEHNTHHILNASLPNKAADSLLNGIKSIVAYYNMYEHVVSTISTDSESALLACKIPLGLMGIKLTDTTPGLHESISERMKRTVSERNNTILADLPFVIPIKLKGELFNYTCETLNNLPNKQTPNSCPNTVITGVKPVIPNYRFGQPGLFYFQSKKETKADYGIIVGYTLDPYHKYRVYFPFTDSIRKCGKFQALCDTF